MVGSRQDLEQSLDLGHRGARELFRIGEQHAGAVRTMLHLAQDVRRREFRIAADLVSDDQRLGWSGKQIDAHAAKQLAFGFGHIGVAWTDEDIDRIDRLRTERHRTDRLNAAQRIDCVGPGHGLRGNNRAGDLALKRGRTGDDPFHARHFGRDYAHVRAG